MNRDMTHGLSRDHLIELDWPPTTPTRKLSVHHNVKADLLKLYETAEKKGLQLDVGSAFRGFDRQLLIWNAKWSGERPVLDDHDQVIDLNAKTGLEKLHAILRFSALPGSSRHHWGTDFDVFDAKKIDAEALQLINAEYDVNGPCYALHQFLSDEKNRCGFFRPYLKDHGGIAIERWHISHEKAARAFEAELTIESLRECLKNTDILGKTIILENLEMIFERYIDVHHD